MYIDDTAYSSFSVTVTSDYTIVLEVTKLAAGDPSVYWFYSPSSIVRVYYTISFSEFDLPQGSTCRVDVNGQSYTSTSSKISLHLENGTCSYSAGSVSNYTATIATSNLKDSGRGASITFTYALNSTSPGGTHWGSLSDSEIIVIPVVVIAIVAILPPDLDWNKS